MSVRPSVHALCLFLTFRFPLILLHLSRSEHPDNSNSCLLLRYASFTHLFRCVRQESVRLKTSTHTGEEKNTEKKSESLFLSSQWDSKPKFNFSIGSKPAETWCINTSVFRTDTICSFIVSLCEYTYRCTVGLVWSKTSVHISCLTHVLLICFVMTRFYI